jgi:hypothetical protein
MKQQINEIKRMQQLAGIILENQASDLISKGVTLYSSDDSKLAPKSIKPKGVGFIVLSITGTLSKNPKVVQIFTNEYGGIVDINYIADFFTNTSKWKAIKSEDELNNFISKYNKVYLINHNGEINKLQESVNEAFNPFLDTKEGGWVRQYIDDVVEDSMDRPNDDEDDEDAIAQLDPKYRDDFDTAFDEALKRLRKDHPELNFEAIIKNKESFF